MYQAPRTHEDLIPPSSLKSLIQIKDMMATYLTRRHNAFIIAIRGRAEGSTRTRSICGKTTSLGQILFTLGLADFHLMLFTTTTQFFGF